MGNIIDFIALLIPPPNWHFRNTLAPNICPGPCTFRALHLEISTVNHVWCTHSMYVQSIWQDLSMQCVQCSLWGPGALQRPSSVRLQRHNAHPLKSNPQSNSMGCPTSSCHCLCPSKQTKEAHSTISAWALQTFTLLRVEGPAGELRVQSSQLERPKISRIVCPALPGLSASHTWKKVSFGNQDNDIRH